MKTNFISSFSRSFFCIAVLFLLTGRTFAQKDTLHLHYVLTQVTLHDTSIAKINNWVKSLKGQHVNIDVVAYYDRAEFKKFAQQRCDELFLIINRKARDLITIQFIGPKKGVNSQRSVADIIYTSVSSTPAVASSEQAKSKEEPAKTKEEPALTKKENRAPAKSEKKENKPVVNNTLAPEKKEREEPAKAPVAASEPLSSEYKNHTMIVVLPEENAERVARLEKKDGAVALYREDIRLLKEKLPAFFTQNWNETKVQVVKESEVGSLDLSGIGNHLILKTERTEMSGIEFITIKAVGSGGAEKVFKVSMMNKNVNDGDLLVLMNKMKVFYSFRKEFDRSQLSEMLTAKTLYFTPEQSEISGSEFSQFYRYNFERAHQETVVSKMNEMDKGMLYLRPEVNNGSVIMTIIDAETGAIISRTQKASGTKVKGSTLKELTDKQKQLTINPLTIY